MKEKTALILEGGGMRGLFTTGVLDRLTERGTCFDTIIGVSAGSCHALSYLSRQFGRARRVNIDYCTRRDYMGLHCLLTEHSVFGWNLIFTRIPTQLDPIDWTELFKHCNSEVNSSSAHPCGFYMTVTNALTGRAEYLFPHNKTEALLFGRASCSLPFIAPPVLINNTPYFDGGIADSIPVRKAESLGCTRFVIVLTQPRGFVKGPVNNQTFIRTYYRRYPNFAQAMTARPGDYNASLAEAARLEQSGAAVVIRPDAAVNVGRMERDPAKLQPLYQNGYDETKALDSAIDALLSC